MRGGLQLTKVPAEGLFVSEPEPFLFGNQNNPVPPPATWSNGSWLKSRFHFSYAEYFDHKKGNFGVLRSMNDVLMQPSRGFGEQGFRNAEVVAYVVAGELTHEQCPKGTPETLTRGGVLFMSAGVGVANAMNNKSSKVPLRIIQMWITPAQKDMRSNRQYGSARVSEEDRRNRWSHVASDSRNSSAPRTPVKLCQDANVYVAELDAGKELPLAVKANRQAYVLCIEGECLRVRLNASSREGDEEAAADETLSEHDALMVVNPSGGPDAQALVWAAPESGAHVLVVEMARSDLREPRLKFPNVWQPEGQAGAASSSRNSSDRGGTSSDAPSQWP